LVSAQVYGKVFTYLYERVPDDEGGGYVAYSQEFPGAIRQGETLEEARENLLDAMAPLRKANRALVKQ